MSIYNKTELATGKSTIICNDGRLFYRILCRYTRYRD
jgi:hypothetical protein